MNNTIIYFRKTLLLVSLIVVFGLTMDAQSTRRHTKKHEKLHQRIDKLEDSGKLSAEQSKKIEKREKNYTEQKENQ